METKRAATNGLAVVGFITLVFLAVVLAGSVARFIPGIVNGTVNGLAAAAVTITSVFVPAETTVVVDTETPDTTFPVVLTPENEDPKPETPVAPVTPKPGNEDTEIVTQNPGGTINDPNGLPDLVPVILATGKLVGGHAADNFIATSDLTRADRIAVKFAVENKGTKETGTNWRFNVIMPTETTYIFEGKTEHVQNLLPGEKIEYVIGFDRPKIGVDLQIAVAIDHNQGVTEIKEDNNGAFVKITVTN